jgi:hypothetical protein
VQTTAHVSQRNVSVGPGQSGQNLHQFTPEEQDTSKVNVSSYRFENWNMSGPAPVIINPEADTHTLIAWCWGEAADLLDLSTGCCTQPNIDAATLAALFCSRMEPLVNMLYHLGNRTANEARPGQAKYN